jgi:hypothetical protein
MQLQYGGSRRPHSHCSATTRFSDPLDTQCQRISRDGPNFRYRFARIQRCETTNLALSPTLEIELNAVDESGTIWL